MLKNYNVLGECRDTGLKSENPLGSNFKGSSTVKWLLSVFALICIFTGFTAHAQVNVTNPGNTTPAMASSYPTLALAIADVNNRTAISGPVTLTLAGAETAPAGGFVVQNAAITGGSNTNRFIFDGAGLTITAGVGTSTTLDGIFKVIGTDFVTIQNFVMNESAGNTTATTQVEWGIAVLYGSTTNGSQGVVIQGNTITLNRVNVNTFGIYSNSTHAAGSPTTSATATTTAGSNSNLKIYSNNISNVNMGVVVVGPTAAADVNAGIEIGGAGLGNTITNFGTSGSISSYANVSGTVNGILIRNSNGFVVSNNTLASSNGGVTAGTLNGIQVPAPSNTTVGTYTNNINNNNISLRSAVATGAMNGITLGNNTGNATSSLNVNGNDFNTFGHTITASGVISFIAVTSTGVYLNMSMSSNTFTNISVNTTGSVTFITNSISTPAGGTKNANNNAIVGTFAKTGAGGTVALLTDGGSSATTTAVQNNNNNFSNITLTGATTMTGWFNNDGTAATPPKQITGNTFTNWVCGANAVNVLQSNFGGSIDLSNNTISNITGGGQIIGINQGSSGTIASTSISNNTVTGLATSGAFTVFGILSIHPSTVTSFSGNTVRNLSSAGASVAGIQHTGAAVTGNFVKNTVSDLAGAASGSLIFGMAVTGLTTTGNISNNRIGDLRSPAANAANAIIGMSLSGTAAATLNVAYNTVNIAGSSAGALFGSSAILANTTPTVNLNNNLLVNNATANGAGLAVAYRRTSATLTTHGAGSDRNDFVASTVYTDGTTPQITISDYKTLVGPTRDANSINVAPNFLSIVSGNVDFLKIDTSIATQIESGAANVVGITDDFEGTIRQGNPGYLTQVNGGGTAPDIGADEFDGQPSLACSGTPAASTITGAASVCTGTGTTLSLSTVYTETGITYQWYSGNTPGGPYPNVLGTGATQATGNLTADTYFQAVITCSSGGATFTTPEMAVTVIVPLAGINPSATTICAGNPVTLTENGGNATSWLWSPGGATTQAITVSPTSTTTYTVTATFNGCSTTANQTITVNPNPTPVTITPSGPVTVCDGTSVNLTATGGTVGGGAGGTVTLGTGTSVTTATTTSAALGPNPLQSYYGGAKQQMIYTAAELTALGMANGSSISSIAFNLSVAETARTLQNYRIKVQHTALSAFSSTAFATGGSLVRNPADLTVVSGWNTIPFDSNFIWNGTDNILVEVNFSNADAGGSGTSTAVYSATTGATTLFYRVDNNTATAVDAATTASFAAYSQRNNTQFTFSGFDANFVWTGPAGLDTYAGANVVATPGPGTHVYTVTSTINGCPSAQSVTINVNANVTNPTSTITSCGPYTWPVNGQVYTVSGSYTSTTNCITDNLILTVNPAAAQNTNTGLYYCTIQDAINDAATLGGHTIAIQPGTYNEQVLVNKSLTITAASTQPTIDFTGTVTGKPTLFDVSADNVTINNIRFNVDLSKLRSAIIASASGLDNIAVTNNLIDAYGTPAGTYGDRNAVSINYGGPANYRVASGGVNSVTYTGNTVNGSGPGSYFRSAISADEVGGTISSNTAITINHDVLVRFGGNGPITISNNTCNGGGMEVAEQNAGAGTVTVSNNTFTGAGAPNTAMLRIKNNNNGIAHVVSGNTFNNYEWAISSENMNNQTIDNNTFNTASATAHALVINTKSISSNSNSIVQVPVGATITNNNFNGTGNAITFQNHDSDNDSYGTFTLGTAGNENDFSASLSSFVVFDAQTGTSTASTFPTYPGTGGWPTTMACWDQNLDARNNNFDVGAGLQLPQAMNFAQRTTLESKLTHDPDASCLGLITYFLPVHNLTQNTYYSTIQSAINVANVNDVIECAEGTYSEAVTINKSLTLQGADSNESLQVIDGSGLGTTSGITVNNGVTNVTIKNFTIQDFTGANGNSNAGIYCQGGNNNLTIDNVASLNNPTASGIYANGPVDTVSITNCTVSNNGGGARGIVIWNGLKSNITITNNTISNNVCCGIELQDGNASAVNISNNTIDVGTGDNAIGLVGLNPSVGANVVNGNTITGGGRYGVEIKNPAGGVTVSNNSVSLTTINADLRDRAGIAVFRRGITAGNVDVPNGVTITANTVDGYTQASVSEGFGIVIEGTNHSVTGNTVTNCEVGVLQQQNPSNYPGDADQSNIADQYFGRGNAPMTCGNTISGNTFSGNGTDTRNIGVGYGLVTNTNTSEAFCSINAAINDAQTLNGHTLNVSAGTYLEDVTINKQLSLLGAGAGVSTVSGPIGGGGSTFQVAAANVLIDGFTITREGNNTTDWNSALNTAGVAIQGQGITAEVRNNEITGMRTGIDVNNSNGNNIHNNNIHFNRTGMIFRNQTDNTIVVNNHINDNWTAGILFLDASGGTNSPVQSAANSNFNDNSISGNWYGQVVDRQTGGSLPAPGANLKDFSCNWYGTTSPVVTTANSAEPGYAAQIPVAYGGTAVAPGGQPDIAGAASANIMYAPLAISGVDLGGVANDGFQPSAPCAAPCDLVVSAIATPIACNGGSSTVTVSATGGTGNYTGTGTFTVTAGTYTYTVTDLNGCVDSETITITEPPVSAGTTTETVCDSYTWAGPLGNGMTYTVSGTYTSVTTNGSGCPHTQTLNLTVNYSTTNGSMTITNAGPYTWAGPLGSGLTYTVSGTYTHTTTNAAGCPNVATLVLTVTPVNSFVIGSSCGATINNMAVTVVTPVVSGASTYTFQLTNTATNTVVLTVNRPVNSLALSNYAGITLGTTYSIRVSTNGGATYGPPCIIITPSPTSTIGAQCGTTLTSMGQFVYATYAPTVTGYRFRVTNTATSAFQVYDALSGQNRFTFNQLPAAFVQFSTIYSVEVALRNTDGTYLPYGPACNITTPTFPTSEVVLSQCDYTATSYNQMINAVVVSGATGYRFQLVNSMLGYNFSIDRTLASFSLSMFPGIMDGTTYTVRVAVRINGVWGPLNGKPCNLTSPGDAPAPPRVNEANTVFAAIAYPNPFADNFMFDVQTTATSSILVRVYDMLGKQLENKTVEAADINNLQFGDAYPSGVYNVIVSQGENTKTIRVIKR